MKPKSISALSYKVVNLNETVKFYESLGFRIAENDGQMAKVYLNWFSIEFHLAGDIDTTPKDGPLVLVSVDFETYYDGIIAAGIKLEYEPQETTSGRREFAIRDPNGYLMVFFEKK